MRFFSFVLISIIIISSNSCKTIVRNNTAKIYAVPSPFQMASLLTLSDLRFNDTLVIMNDNKVYNSNDSKALDLGMKIVDFAYYSLFLKHKKAQEIASQINLLSYELGLKKPVNDNFLMRYKKNFDNKDSLELYNKILQKEIEDLFNEAIEKDIEHLILSGLFVEQIYLGINYYNNQISDKLVSRLFNKPMKKMFVEQKNYVENILKIYKNKFYYKPDLVVRDLDMIKNYVDSLNIEYKFNERNNRVKNIKFDRNYIYKLDSVISIVRTDFANYSN